MNIKLLINFQMIVGNYLHTGHEGKEDLVFVILQCKGYSKFEKKHIVIKLLFISLSW